MLLAEHLNYFFYQRWVIHSNTDTFLNRLCKDSKKYKNQNPLKNANSKNIFSNFENSKVTLKICVKVQTFRMLRFTESCTKSLTKKLVFRPSAANVPILSRRTSLEWIVTFLPKGLSLLNAFAEEKTEELVWALIYMNVSFSHLVAG